jgi:hypothetical protein
MIKDYQMQPYLYGANTYEGVILRKKWPDTPQEMAELINYLRPLAKSAELELHESFISGMERAAELKEQVRVDCSAMPNSSIDAALQHYERAIRAELEPVTQPEQER